MKTFAKAVVSVAVAAASALGVPALAQAATSASPTTAAAADGNLYVYRDYNFTTLCGRWPGNKPNWGGCGGTISSLWNNGYPGSYDDVWVYSGINYTGYKRGVYNGVRLPDLRGYKFDGSSVVLDNNIWSHKWTNLP